MSETTKPGRMALRDDRNDVAKVREALVAHADPAALALFDRLTAERAAMHEELCGWRILPAALDRLFSYRRSFYSALEQEAATHNHSVTPPWHVAWPDVLTVLRHDLPAAFERAADAAEQERSGRAALTT